MIMQLGRKDLDPPKPKRNMGKRTFKYSETIYFSSLPNCVKSATSLNSFKNMIIKYFTKNWIYTKCTQCKFVEKKCKLRLNQRQRR